jgi:hypothetical protein
MTVGAVDLSIVTDHIIGELEAAKPHARLWDDVDKFDIDFTGLPPRHLSKPETCLVSLYLFHASPNAAHRNTFPQGGQARTVPEQPLALTLYYLLSAHAVKSYLHEQQAMSLALKYLHEHPVMTAAVPRRPPQTHVERFTLTMEPQTIDEVGRLWLALATPLALSAIFRAEVVFIAPEEPPAVAVGIVLEPHVDAVATRAVEPSSLASAPTSTGTATVTGSHFDASTIVLRIGGLTFTVVATAPPGPGEAHVVSPSELQVSLPSGTRRGRYLLRISHTADGPVEDVLLDIENDVP